MPKKTATKTKPQPTNDIEAKAAGPGRVEGTKNAVRVQVETVPSRCPSCGSTSREDYQRSPEVDRIRGIRDGLPYTRIERRATCCKQCGQHRYDLSYHNQPEVDFPQFQPIKG